MPQMNVIRLKMLTLALLFASWNLDIVVCRLCSVCSPDRAHPAIIISHFFFLSTSKLSLSRIKNQTKSTSKTLFGNYFLVIIWSYIPRLKLKEKFLMQDQVLFIKLRKRTQPKAWDIWKQSIVLLDNMCS